MLKGVKKLKYYFININNKYKILKINTLNTQYGEESS